MEGKKVCEVFFLCFLLLVTTPGLASAKVRWCYSACVKDCRHYGGNMLYCGGACFGVCWRATPFQSSLVDAKLPDELKGNIDKALEKYAGKGLGEPPKPHV
ncbi:hypothetical protein QJS10_CPB19g00804 [Acorus calamus]|uniref:Uncharacterized protein n=1 Tax=Acorus calamus TaxID=4465 RepID=A0AAV9CHK3_ACOCL|nr:hypothetical protein QJS10_CPB19g00804 [Acorus calamus]